MFLVSSPSSNYILGSNCMQSLKTIIILKTHSTHKKQDKDMRIKEMHKKRRR